MLESRPLGPTARAAVFGGLHGRPPDRIRRRRYRCGDADRRVDGRRAAGRQRRPDRHHHSQRRDLHRRPGRRDGGSARHPRQPDSARRQRTRDPAAAAAADQRHRRPRRCRAARLQRRAPPPRQRRHQPPPCRSQRRGDDRGHRIADRGMGDAEYRRGMGPRRRLVLRRISWRPSDPAAARRDRARSPGADPQLRQTHLVGEYQGAQAGPHHEADAQPAAGRDRERPADRGADRCAQGGRDSARRQARAGADENRSLERPARRARRSAPLRHHERSIHRRYG